ncbi:MAG: DNA polymerase III subunit gamma/tau [Fimbriimonadaceae bacterium]
MSRVTLYRKYRSQTFSDLVGQEHVVRTLLNSLASGSVAQSYLFTGPRGTGKTSTARLLAKALNCEDESSPEPCNQCEACSSINENRAMDVVEIDAASEASVEDVRSSIVEAVEYRPAALRHKVYIIDEVHDLSPKAFDALLKTIEEPPEHVVFVLATTEAQKVPATIRSRCLRFEFHRGSVANIASRLRYVADQEGIKVGDAVLSRIARMAEGGYRDALSLLELVSYSADGEIEEAHVLQQLGAVPDDDLDTLVLGIGRGDAAVVLATLDGLYQRGIDARTISNELLSRVGELTRAAFEAESGPDAATLAAASATAMEVGLETLARIREAAVEAHVALRDSTLPRTWMEARLLMAGAPKPARREPAPKPAETVQPAPAQAVTETPARAEEAAAPNVAPESQSATVDSETQAPVPTGDAETDKLRGIWFTAYGELCAASKSAGARLHGAVVRRLDNGVAVLEFSRVLNYDWVMESAKRQGLIRKAWDAAGGGATELVFAAAAPQTKSVPEVATTSVQLRLTGKELAEAAENVFAAGGQDTP